MTAKKTRHTKMVTIWERPLRKETTNLEIK